MGVDLNYVTPKLDPRSDAQEVSEWDLVDDLEAMSVGAKNH